MKGKFTKELLTEQFILDINTKYDSNIYIYHCGWEKCKPKHSYGPAVRDHFLIHFVLDGQGKLYIEDKVYEIKMNQGFLISPDDITYYEADEKNPWNYLWVGFNGIKATQYLKEIGLDKNSPVIKPKDSDFIIDCLKKLNESSKTTRGREVRMLGYLYLFLSKLIEESKESTILPYKDEYINKAVEYIEMNYSRNITIKNIAEHLGLNRSYFSSLFKSTLNVSPQKFLIHYRISKACELLKYNTNLNIGDIARSVGYTDPLVFSKTFKSIKGCSPSSYRIQLNEEKRL
ncbi:AraC family transcriptional regulator [Oceanirhabdus seepicola]|uniref:AraC family transcriptional regulator n=1 Tax=Oceanirhabdus seepicola TaxID=2828781 RepID=A0A9J6NZT8_9CLOT|nr:AraC family transcriptional regulator [Oceanirhabdus seepicola]MCM1988672.1 AraC family transcriptional regulator [Oceanirhabdus seepicola]